MISFKPSDLPLPRLHQYLLGGVAPRPIALASTLDEQDRPNLSPFSFFNAFGVNPTTLIFSPSRRGRDNTTKDTFENLKRIPEVVINAVNLDIVQQTSLASTEYETGVNEFVKAGLTMQPSELVRPFRVKESPLQFECKVRQIIETGDKGGAANLVICEILVMHLAEGVLDEDRMIDPDKIQLVGRMGKNYYARAFGEALFEVEKPLARKGIGIDSLPDKIKHSKYLTGNDLGMLGNVEALPEGSELNDFRNEEWVKELPFNDTEVIFNSVKELLSQGKTWEALKLLMLMDH